jgi:hypothetical protein
MINHVSKAISACAVLCCALHTLAQSYSIGWSTIDGGGSTSTGDGFSVTGTIGQPDANGAMAGSGFSLTGGFWSVFSAVPTPGAPLLSIARTATNTVAVAWPVPATDWVLQQNSDLKTTNWTAVAQPPATVGTNRVVIINPPVGTRFFRLPNP